MCEKNFGWGTNINFSIEKKVQQKYFWMSFAIMIGSTIITQLVVTFISKMKAVKVVMD